MSPILNPAPPWRPDLSDYIVLYHGCTAFDKNRIEANGIDVNVCRVDTDFGRGFYTTTIERQARHWAWDRYYKWLADPASVGKTGNQPVVLRFRVRRYTRVGSRKFLDRGIDKLSSLHFVVGDYDSGDFWGLVQHCRRSTLTAIHDHRRPSGGWYDLVTGPVAAFWQQRVAMLSADQLSFHTVAGQSILNALIASGKKGARDDYRWDPVP
jgi:hypothetical protein